MRSECHWRHTKSVEESILGPFKLQNRDESVLSNQLSYKRVRPEPSAGVCDRTFYLDIIDGGELTAELLEKPRRSWGRSEETEKE